jgi:hypothetical protein
MHICSCTRKKHTLAISLRPLNALTQRRLAQTVEVNTCQTHEGNHWNLKKQKHKQKAPPTLDPKQKQRRSRNAKSLDSPRQFLDSSSTEACFPRQLLDSSSTEARFPRLPFDSSSTDFGGEARFAHLPGLPPKAFAPPKGKNTQIVEQNTQGDH